MKDPLDFMNFTHPIRARQSATMSRRNERLASTARSRNLKCLSARSNTTYLTSTARMQPTLDCWSDLSESVHDFSRRCFIDETDPEFLNQFARVDHQFNDFSRHARTIFNNLRPSKDLTIHPSAALIKVGNLMIKEWKQFITLFISIASGGVQNQFNLMSSRYSLLSKSLYELGLHFAEPQPTLAIGAVHKVKAYIDYIRKTAEHQSKVSLTYNSEDFDADSFSQKLVDLNSWVYNLFQNVLPPSAMGINGLLSTKRNLLLACNELQNLFDGIVNFNAIGNDTKNHIELMNQEFDKIFTTLNLPMRVSNQDFKEDVKNNENIEKVDKIHTHLIEMEQLVTPQPQ